MANRITRWFRALTGDKSYAVTTSEATAEPIDIRDVAGCHLYILTAGAASVTTLTYYGAPTPEGDSEGNFLPMQDKNGNAVVQTVAKSKTFPLHEAAFAVGAVKLVGNAAGTIDVSEKA